jgi:short-subunit dehydrogenase
VIATTETEEQVHSLQREIASSGIILEIFKLDITHEEDRKKIEAYDLDVLINNAGTGESGSLAEININKVRNNFEVNVFSAFELSQLALKKMLDKNHGTILFVSSLAARVTIPFLGSYCMTKSALSSGAEAMRKEIQRIRQNVHVSIIEPGAYHTGFNQRNIAKKYAWMNDQSVFYSILDQLKSREEKQFKLVESGSTASIVRKIVKAAEARRPGLRYSAP